MSEWDHYSLEWIHKVREKNYEETKDLPTSEVVRKSVERAKRIMKKYKKGEE
jgi:hypothetical protein